MDAFRDIIATAGGLLLPLVIVGFPLYGLLKRVPVYESFVSGAKEGFPVAIMIVPYLVAIFVAIGMFRASGAMDLLSDAMRPMLEPLGFPVDALPMALIRPLTGSGSLGILSEMVTVHGRDDFATSVAATIYGSTETTFYVIAVYFGAVGIRRTRHAIAAGLTADFAAVVFAVIIVRLLVG